MFFHWFEPSFKMFDVRNEAWRMAKWWRLLLFVLCGSGGLLYAAALPPLNWSFAAFVCLIPVLVFVSLERRWPLHFAAGWFWSWCHAVCAYSFLREIEWFIPWLLAPVMGLFPAVWALLAARILRPMVFPLAVDAAGIDDRKTYLERGPQVWRLVLLGLAAAALFTAIEFSRSRLFVWNDLSVTQYRTTWFIQLAALTGSYGVGFCVALVNSALYLLCFRRGWRATLILLGLVVLLIGSGWWYSGMVAAANAAGKRAVWKVLAIQGDLSQRRNASLEQVVEALTVYENLSLQALEATPDADALIWPESAVPIVYYSMLDLAGKRLKGEAGRLHTRYQETVKRIARRRGLPLIFGALDMEEGAFILKRESPGATNSALMMGGDGILCARYDKFHRVPYGEYVPGRRLLPAGWKRISCLLYNRIILIKIVWESIEIQTRRLNNAGRICIPLSGDQSAFTCFDRHNTEKNLGTVKNGSSEEFCDVYSCGNGFLRLRYCICSDKQRSFHIRSSRYYCKIDM